LEETFPERAAASKWRSWRGETENWQQEGGEWFSTTAHTSGVESAVEKW
jgi:hypothetical protein